MANIVDILLIGGGAYYLANRLNESDDSFKRLLIGTAVGVPAALKGPEFYNKWVKEYDQLDQDQQDRLKYSALLGVSGYVFGNKLGDVFKK